MSEACAGGSDSVAIRRSGPPDWLGLAAAPTFAAMALLTGLSDGDALNMLCGPAHVGSPLSGMAAMYLLMGAFHLQPWLNLIPRRRSGAHA